MNSYKAVVRCKDGAVLKFTVDNCGDWAEARFKAFEVAVKDHDTSEELILDVAVIWGLE